VPSRSGFVPPSSALCRRAPRGSFANGLHQGKQFRRLKPRESMGLNMTYEPDERKVRVQADLSVYVWFVSEDRVEPYAHPWLYRGSSPLPRNW
jgi:hypothetical protein